MNMSSPPSAPPALPTLPDAAGPWSALARAARALAAGWVRRLRDGVFAAGRGDGPPDLDELWRDFNNKLGGLFGGRKPQRPMSNGGGDGGGGGNFQPDMKSAGIGFGLIAGVVLLIWLGSGFFIVQEGQQAVITSFGRYTGTVGAGFNWRFPAPFQAHETVPFTQLRTVEVGSNRVVPATGLRESSMLTQDENIVDIRFTVQYRLTDARDYLFENRNPDEAVVLAAESAVRSIVGNSTMDLVLYAGRDVLAADMLKSIQQQLDQLKAGILVVNTNIQSVQAPEQVQAAFDDAFKAGADRERLKNEGQAYANDVIPRARGDAARLTEESQGYKSRVIAQAQGDTQRFTSVLAEYKRAPTVTRDRMYIDAMQQVLSNVSKVMVDVRNNSNLLYLPLDKLLQQSAAGPAAAAPSTAAVPVVPPPPAAGGNTSDSRSRDGLRSRDRDGR